MHEVYWTALVTEPAAEYLACTELQRYGLKPYLPQFKKRWNAPKGAGIVLRRFPLFPRYLLINIDDAHDPAIRLARGVNRLRPVLADDNGVPWRVAASIVDAIRIAEAKGDFDEAPHRAGDRITMRHGVLAGIEGIVGKTQAAKTLQLLMPLLGGARVTAAQSAVMRA